MKSEWNENVGGETNEEEEKVEEEEEEIREGKLIVGVHEQWEEFVNCDSASDENPCRCLCFGFDLQMT